MTNRIRAVLKRLSGRTAAGSTVSTTPSAAGRAASTGKDRSRQKQAAALRARRQARECRDYFSGSSGWAGR